MSEESCIDQTERLCDFCNESKALLYCRADSAKLCFSCDLEVHSTNPLFQKHNRSLLCDSCSSSPSSIFCSTESTVLCQNCDWEIHNTFASIHDRRPLEGFSGCPSLTDLLRFLGLQDFEKNKSDLGAGNEFLDMLVWETPTVVTINDLIVANNYDDSAPALQATALPPFPKNRNASCGKHKEEIFSQLREMAKKDPNYSGSLEEDFEAFVENNQPQVAAKCPTGLETKAEPASIGDWCFVDEGFPSAYFGDFISEMSHLVPDKDSDSAGVGNGIQDIQPCVPVDSQAFQLPPTAATRELNSQERDSALSRYKEKKKTRRYDKHVRYESRKVRAESRVRIKGRFAKKDR
ncbi:zinc finger protein CONSTANS-LIKE 13-like [Salvia hispanica]|uniref:zinc finger protein CONSTANS-LIKE 13-like n=1 Tax=Salvia hispanica TaxID=49212 RepID=UPI002009D9BF|nr:zinc finger protein CONSTANS-LIKE 13-like [Salvia hispanica]